MALENLLPVKALSLPNPRIEGLHEPSLNTIRVETAFRYPIHQLDKSRIGDVIEIDKPLANGVKEYWRVKHTPGPLSYQIDTLVINRKLDEVGWGSIPQLLALGSLSSICRMLNRSDSGTSRKDIREALERNAGALITADFQYQLKSEEAKKTGRKTYAHFRGTFSRYAVYFAGMTLPTGKSADCTYVHFNHLYYQALKNATLRPLDFDYLKALTVGAQKFYEIVSYRIFAALRQRRDAAWISYSDYCLFSNQKRYARRSQMVTQMNRLQQPHVESRYLAQFASYIECIDEHGRKDWKIVLVPGSKARQEFDFFTNRRGNQHLVDGTNRTTVNLDLDPQRQLIDSLVEVGVPERKAQAMVELFPERVQKFIASPTNSSLTQLLPELKTKAGANVDSASTAAHRPFGVSDFSDSAKQQISSVEVQSLQDRFQSQFAALGIKVTKRINSALANATPESVNKALEYVKNYQSTHHVRSRAGLFVRALEEGWIAPGKSKANIRKVVAAASQSTAQKPVIQKSESQEVERHAFKIYFEGLPPEEKQSLTNAAIDALPSRYQSLLSRVVSEDLKKRTLESAIFDYWRLHQRGVADVKQDETNSKL